MKSLWIAVAAIGICQSVAVGGCATGDRRIDGASDPLEIINRPAFYIDAALDTAIVVPLTWTYKTVLPTEVRGGLHNALANLRAPYIAANDVLQARPCAAIDTGTRFLVNSTIGIAGIYDFAAQLGVPAHENDLAATFKAYGVDGGPYLVLPLLGPADLRSAIARAAELAADPADFAIAAYVGNAGVWARFAADTIDERSREPVDEVEVITHSADPYIAMRTAFWNAQAMSDASQPPACHVLSSAEPSR